MWKNAHENCVISTQKREKGKEKKLEIMQIFQSFPANLWLIYERVRSERSEKQQGALAVPEKDLPDVSSCLLSSGTCCIYEVERISNGKRVSLGESSKSLSLLPSPSCPTP